MLKFYGWNDENMVMRFFHNEQLCIMTMKNNDIVLNVNDVKGGGSRTWKVKIDPNCDYIYSVQKTQIKTILTDMSKFADIILDHLYSRLAECCGFQIDYNYDIEKISEQA